MAIHPYNVLSLCAGIGGIDLGLRIARPEARTVCYVEIEVPAALKLAARFEDGSLDPAPVWSNLKSFDGRPWRGRVQALVAGYPCQPFSCAGLQKGEEDPRHLWPHVARIIDEVDPDEALLENVANHLNIGFESVRAQLLAMGRGVAAGLFTAAEVGSSHLRKRLFVLTYRQCQLCGGSLAHGAGRGCGELRESSGGDRFTYGSGPQLANADGGGRSGRRGLSFEGGPAADAPRGGKAVADARDGQLPVERRRSQGRNGAGPAGAALADCPDHHRRRGIREAQEGAGAYGLGRRRSSGGGGSFPAFPPGPDDLASWEAVLERYPETEPAVCGVADGISPRVDRLRALGNGVVPLMAAHAYRTLRSAVPACSC